MKKGVKKAGEAAGLGIGGLLFIAFLIWGITENAKPPRQRSVKSRSVRGKISRLLKWRPKLKLRR